MEAFIDFLKANPLYTAGAAALLLFFVISLLKKGITLAIVALLLNAGYGYFVHEKAQDYYEQLQLKADAAKEKLEQTQRQYESMKQTMDKASDTVEKAGDLFDKASKLVDQ